MRNSFHIEPRTKVSLKKFDTAFTGEYSSKQDAKEKLEQSVKKLAAMQDILYASDTYGLLLIFQAMDAAGKDSTIKHVMSGVNPQGCQVFSFKTPSAEEQDHDFLWRYMKALPERGRIGIFNRSYYEDVLIVRVHDAIREKLKLPASAMTEDMWKHRFEDINNLERYLTRNGIIVLKFFLHVSKGEQKKRFLKRINTPEKNWKFSLQDVRERQHWDKYMHAYEEVLTHTSTEYAPWYVIPADHKWFTRVAVSEIILSRLESLDLQYPVVSDEHKRELEKARIALESE